MTSSELVHLELLAEVDALVVELKDWADSAPAWPAARSCQAFIRRLVDRADSLRIRLEAPLVVATLGGTGTGKSTLVNALAGDDVTSAGKERPTTRMPTLVCKPQLSAESLGIPADSVNVVHSESSALRDLVLLDCPDPDTTEQDGGASGDESGHEHTAHSMTNLARLRELLPHCDVLLVTATQQKYRSARVQSELAAAAQGARIVFVQTHADTDTDIREDWRKQLETDYDIGEMFFVDSLQALQDAKARIAPRGEFARLGDFLTRELSKSAANRIRRANFLELVSETLRICQGKIAESHGAVESLQAAISEQRGRLSARLVGQLREELLASRRHWENRLLGEVAGRYGFSPFSLVLRTYQGLGGLVASLALARVRTPGQLALWGAWQAGRKLRAGSKTRQAAEALEETVAWSWDDAELRTAAIIVSGHAHEAGLPTPELRTETFQESAADAGTAFVKRASGQLQEVVSRHATKHTGWFTRMFYEVLLLVMVGVIVFRLAMIYFWDSWVAPMFGREGNAPPLDGVSFFLYSAFFLLLWSAVLMWLFLGRLRRGLKREINTMAQHWQTEVPAAGLFTELENNAAEIARFGDRLEVLRMNVEHLSDRMTHAASGLTRRREAANREPLPAKEMPPA